MDQYRYDLLAQALRISEDDARAIILPRVLGPNEAAGTGDSSRGWGEMVLGPGAGDNAAASLGINMGTGDVSISIGTSGVVAAVSPNRFWTPPASSTGSPPPPVSTSPGRDPQRLQSSGRGG